MAELRVMDALRGKRSELSGAVSRLEQQLARHRGSLAHLDATMRLFDPDLVSQDPDLVSQDPDLAPQQGRVSWFRPGECRRLIYDVLRDAAQPLATRDLAVRVMAARGTPAADSRTRALIQKTVLASLSRANGTIERTEVAGVVSWRVRQAA